MINKIFPIETHKTIPVSVVSIELSILDDKGYRLIFREKAYHLGIPSSGTNVVLTKSSIINI